MARDEISEYVRTVEALERVTKTLPAKAATIAVNFTKERFKAQNWIGDRTIPWKKRKTETGRKKGGKRAILVNKGRLRRSIRKIEVTEEHAKIGTDVEYAQIHNDGGSYRGTVRVGTYTRKQGRRKGKSGKKQRGSVQVASHTRKMRWRMPQRQFIGASPILDKQVQRMMTAAFNRALGG